MALKPENPTAEEKERWLDIEAAAVWWRTAWDIGVELVREGRPTERVDCQVSPAGITDAQADAKALLRACAAALGRDLARVVEWCLGLDMPWHVMGGYLGCDYRTAQDVARLALDALAVYHREISVSGRQRFSA